jgi:DNA-binding LacI/PurR family transcriptional regulator
VAEAAGVSIWTASNTFSNPDRVAEATRARVLAAADALDYAGPNPGARTLALGRTGMVALVSPHEASALLADPGAALVARGLLAVCDRSGLSLALAGRDGQQAVDGRAFYRSSPGQAVRGPMVIVDGRDDAVPCVRVEAAAAAAELARLLLGLGHRRIAVIAGSEDDERLDGAAGVLQELGPVSVYRTAEDTWSADAHGELAARQALGATPRPTAVMALTDLLAAGTLDAAAQLGLRVPQDVSVTGIGDLPGSAARGLTTALVPYRPMGELAGSVLVARIAGEPAPELPALPAPLAIRASTGPPPAE